MATARARLYGLLAATFDGEAETAADALDRGAFAAVADVFPIDIETADLRGGYDADSLAIGYDNLFVVPGTHYVPPFASAHAIDPSEAFESDSRYHTAGEAGELLGDPAADMAQLYAAAGFSPERGDDIPDHIAACFEFMRALCEREAALLEGDGSESNLDAVREIQARTLSRLGWIDRFEEAVASRDTVEGVFAAIARLARTFTAWDAQEVVQADEQPSETAPS
ncbi:dehydrogenase [Halorubrum saccharovorum]|uniref:Dehydrogenase n=2 Tax=Halorubrum saccharovorum TaxID=2248 RepID=A0A0F8AUI5_9EURY|nr:dehydrogenase [Halorubrum saccharovorum]